MLETSLCNRVAVVLIMHLGILVGIDLVLVDRMGERKILRLCEEVIQQTSLALISFLWGKFV